MGVVKQGVLGLRTALIALLCLGLSGCGAIWDSIYPPVETRDQMVFHVAKDTPYANWQLKMGPLGNPTVYVQPEPLFKGSAIEMVEPMRDASGTYFVGVMVSPDAATRLAQATQSPPVLITLLWQGGLFKVLPVQEPITGGTFAIAVKDAASADILSRVLSDRSPL